jgi:hypothetical protein
MLYVLWFFAFLGVAALFPVAFWLESRSKGDDAWPG